MSDTFMSDIQSELLEDLESDQVIDLEVSSNSHMETILSNMDPEDIPIELNWVAFIYSGKPRFGLDLGQDERYTPNHIGIMCVEGYKIFLKHKMVGFRQVNPK